MEDMPGRVKGQIETLCYEVQRGKPAAMMPVLSRHSERITCYIHSEFHLKTFTETLVDGWTALWIYRKDFMADVIRSLPEEPKTVFEHWVLGKVFGYSDEAISEFLETYTLSNSVPLHFGQGGNVSV